tara:strand:- start:1800 stop:1991 length:192 start_codon:yes stop_codon:yes gene_type:complete
MSSNEASIYSQDKEGACILHYVGAYENGQDKSIYLSKLVRGQPIDVINNKEGLTFRRLILGQL